MSTLNVNFDDVPDSNTPEPGQYSAQITGVPEQKLNKRQDGNNLVVEVSITQGPFEGRTIRDYIPIGTMTTKIKRLAAAAGVVADANGLNLEELAGKDVQIVVTNTPSDDNSRMYANIADYLPA